MIIQLRAVFSRVKLDRVLIELGPTTHRPLEIRDSSNRAVILTLFPNKVRYEHPDDDPDNPNSWTLPGPKFWTTERYGQEIWKVELQ